MADDLKNLAITITVEGGAQAKAALDKISSAFDATAREAKNADSKIKDMGEELTSFGVFVATTAANAVTALARELTQLGITLARDVINEAAEGEKSFLELSAAVSRAGLDVETTTKELDDYATALAATTKFTDDEIKSAEALALSIGMTTDEIKAYFGTAADLAIGKGVSLKDAVLGITKSLEGQAGSLQRFMPELKEYTEEQLKAGAAVDYIRKAFGGAAFAEINTFTGAVGQLKKAWQDILETVGGPIIEALRPAIVDLTKFMQSFVGGEQLTNFGKEIGDALVEAGAWLLNFYWFLKGEQSVFGKLGWDEGGTVWDRFLESIGQAIEAIVDKLIKLLNDPKVYEAMFQVGVRLSGAVIKGVLSGLFAEDLKRLDVALGYIAGTLEGGPMAQTYQEYATSQGLKGYGPSTSQTKQTIINQDIKIQANGETAPALERQLKSTISQFKTDVVR